jgi:Ca-activated chloride channel family protein
MRTAALENIGTTVFGVGSEFGDDVALEISQIRGGNAVFLGDFETIVNVFENEFAFLVAPVVYDIALTVEIPFEFDVVDVHGLPAEEPFGHTLSLRAPTLFLSPRQSVGEAFVRLRAGSLVDFNVPNLIGTVSLNYTTPDGDLVGEGPYAAQLPADLQPDADPSYFQFQSVQRGVLLLNTALTLKAACEDVYQFGFLSFDTASRNTAITRITEFLDYFDSLAEGLADRLTPDSRSLSQERALLVKLRANLGG